MERGQMIKRKALPSDQSKMYVYVQDRIDKWKREFPLEMARKKLGITSIHQLSFNDFI